MAIEFTSSQRSAIEARANKILVSAAAGSGKSTVLTERIISSLTERGLDISRLLVVTFTHASADDLKMKIANALRDAAARQPKNRHLYEQLIKLPSAQISTIHGLCLSLIKNNFTSLELSASLRVGDETEINTLKADVMDKLLEDALCGAFAPSEDFVKCFDNFISERDEKLAELFFNLYSKVKNHPNGFKSWEDSINIMRSGNLEPNNPYCKLLCRYAEIYSDYAVMLCTSAIEYFKTDEKYFSAIENFENQRLFCARLHELAVKCDYRAIRSFLLTFSIEKLSIVKAEFKTPEGEYYRNDVKKFIKDFIVSLRDKYFCFSDEDISYLSKGNADISHSLLEFLREFDKRFSEEKKKRSVLDFNDMEHFSVKLLYEDTDMAKKLSSSFDEIYVDEYQDVNPLQNKIFEALSVNTPIFMVGDIKQSIYAFRGAMPSIFSNYRRTFSELSENNPQSAKIFLSENFRSANTVLEFANAVSDAMFYTPKQKAFDYRIPYSKEDRLVCKNDIPNAPNVEILIAASEKADTSEDGEKSKAKISLEAEMVARRIKALVNNGVNESEITILMRSGKHAPKFERALRAQGIAVSADRGSSLFENPEIQLALCLLNCIDNPYRDIFLAGALKSPIFSFTLDDLITIRRDKKNYSLYKALVSYTYSHDFQKGTRFLSFLERMRIFSVSNPVDRVRWQLYTETSFFSLIHDSENINSSTVSRRRANLLKLHSLAVSFVSSGKNDLYSFVERLRKISEGENPPSAASDEGSGVKIMTAHSSKGLEFEYCFLCGTGHSFNTQDQSKALIYHEEYGACLKVKDELCLTSSDSPYRLALSSLLKLSQADEEMRLLYVMLTRAKKALFITAELKNYEKAELVSQMSAKNPHPVAFLSKHSYIDWILTALKVKTDLAPRFKTTIMCEEEILYEIDSNITTSENKLKAELTPSVDIEKLRAKLTFKYPHTHSANIPSKLAVSRLYPGILDESDDIIPDFDGSELPFVFEDDSDIPDNSSSLVTPKFLVNEPFYSGAERGTATHIFMQFCDFEMLEKNGIENEIKRLTEKRFITEQMSELVNKKQIEGFLNSEIFFEMKNASELQREYRFNIKLPASEFTNDAVLKEALKSDHIFVQGVIDCYYKTHDKKMVLLDYKTDRVPNDILGNAELENEFFISRYARQLSYYETALERLTGKRADDVIIYSFALGRTIKITSKKDKNND